MSAALKLLEDIARSPVSLSEEALAAMLAGASLQAVMRDALLARDAVAISRLLGARATMICNVVLPGYEESEPAWPESAAPDGDTLQIAASW